MKSFDGDIYPAIRQYFTVEVKTGYVGDDFMRDVYTLRIVTKFKQFRYVYHQRVSDEVVEDTAFFNAVITRGSRDVIKTIWRINQKRVAHGLDSWFI